MYALGGEIDFLSARSDPRVIYDLTKGTFLADHDSADPKTSPPFLPNLKITYLYCKASVWTCVVGSWDIEDDIAKWKKEGRVLRPITIHGVDGANHFVSPEYCSETETLIYHHSFSFTGMSRLLS